MTSIIKEPSEGELVEAVVVPVVVFIREHLLLRSQLVRVDGVEVAGVLGELDLRLVRSCSVAKVLGEVNAAEEVMILDLIRTILAKSLLFTRTQRQYKGLGLFTQPGLSWYP